MQNGGLSNILNPYSLLTGGNLANPASSSQLNSAAASLLKNNNPYAGEILQFCPRSTK